MERSYSIIRMPIIEYLRERYYVVCTVLTLPHILHTPSPHICLIPFFQSLFIQQPQNAGDSNIPVPSKHFHPSFHISPSYPYVSFIMVLTSKDLIVCTKTCLRREIMICNRFNSTVHQPRHQVPTLLEILVLLSLNAPTTLSPTSSKHRTALSALLFHHMTHWLLCALINLMDASANVTTAVRLTKPPTHILQTPSHAQFLSREAFIVIWYGSLL